jgi:hypothetical protein
MNTLLVYVTKKRVAELRTTSRPKARPSHPLSKSRLVSYTSTPQTPSRHDAQLFRRGITVSLRGEVPRGLIEDISYTNNTTLMSVD